MAKIINVDDIIGKRFGGWKVVRYIGFTVEGRFRRRWYECECLSCKKHYGLRRDSLLGSNSKMCSHCSKNRHGSIPIEKFKLWPNLN